MKKLFVLITLFATPWQVFADSIDWGSRLAAEQEWLVSSLTPPAQPQISEEIIEEDSISTGQAAPTRAAQESFEISNPWDPTNSAAPDYQPTRKRSR